MRNGSGCHSCCDGLMQLRLHSAAERPGSRASRCSRHVLRASADARAAHHRSHQKHAPPHASHLIGRARTCWGGAQGARSGEARKAEAAHAGQPGCARATVKRARFRSPSSPRKSLTDNSEAESSAGLHAESDQLPQECMQKVTVPHATVLKPNQSFRTDRGANPGRS